VLAVRRPVLAVRRPVLAVRRPVLAPWRAAAQALGRGAGVLLLAAAMLAGPALAGTLTSASAGGGGGLCTVNLGGQWITVQCVNGGGSGGNPPGGGGGPASTVNLGCTLTPISQATAVELGLQWPPPKGFSWAFMDCVGGRVGAGGALAVLVNTATGAPQVTPQQLLQQALSELQIPTLRPHTAPPRGKDGLVGLPEWFWVPAGLWHPLSVTVTAGPVWATATASPIGLAFQPGGGLAPVTCTGPGTAYDPARPAAAQHSGCAFTYQQPSVGQPGNAYQASIAVTWNVSWTGSGGVGGEIDAGLVVPFQFAIPVAQGEALVNNP
jgi:hypothetical protein